MVGGEKERGERQASVHQIACSGQPKIGERCEVEKKAEGAINGERSRKDQPPCRAYVLVASTQGYIHRPGFNSRHRHFRSPPAPPTSILMVPLGPRLDFITSCRPLAALMFMKSAASLDMISAFGLTDFRLEEAMVEAWRGWCGGYFLFLCVQRSDGWRSKQSEVRETKREARVFGQFLQFGSLRSRLPLACAPRQ